MDRNHIICVPEHCYAWCRVDELQGSVLATTDLYSCFGVFCVAKDNGVIRAGCAHLDGESISEYLPSLNGFLDNVQGHGHLDIYLFGCEKFELESKRNYDTRCAFTAPLSFEALIERRSGVTYKGSHIWSDYDYPSMLCVVSSNGDVSFYADHDDRRDLSDQLRVRSREVSSYLGGKSPIQHNELVIDSLVDCTTENEVGHVIRASISSVKKPFLCSE